jgi:hypothetical protein
MNQLKSDSRAVNCARRSGRMVRVEVGKLLGVQDIVVSPPDSIPSHTPVSGIPRPETCVSGCWKTRLAAIAAYMGMPRMATRKIARCCRRNSASTRWRTTSRGCVRWQSERRKVASGVSVSERNRRKKGETAREMRQKAGLLPLNRLMARKTGVRKICGIREGFFKLPRSNRRGNLKRGASVLVVNCVGIRQLQSSLRVC